MLSHHSYLLYRIIFLNPLLFSILHQQCWLCQERLWLSTNVFFTESNSLIFFFFFCSYCVLRDKGWNHCPKTRDMAWLPKCHQALLSAWRPPVSRRDRPQTIIKPSSMAIVAVVLVFFLPPPMTRHSWNAGHCSEALWLLLLVALDWYDNWF